MHSDGSSRIIRVYLKISQINVENVPIKLMLKLFSSIVTPILLYGCEVWGPYLLGRINSFDMFKKNIFQINSAIEKLI